MEGTAQEFHSLSSMFGVYAVHHARSHSRSVSDIWHSLVLLLLQSSCTSQRWENPQDACPALLATKPCLAVPERQRLPQRAVLEDGVTRGVPVSELTHSLLPVTRHWHETMQSCCSSGHSTGCAAIAHCFHLCDRPTKRLESLGQPPDFRVSVLPLKEEEKNDVPKMVWSKTEKDPVPVLTWTLIMTERTPPSPYCRA